jgi:hypothetical protein
MAYAERRWELVGSFVGCGAGSRAVAVRVGMGRDADLEVRVSAMGMLEKEISGRETIQCPKSAVQNPSRMVWVLNTAVIWVTVKKA